MHPFSATVLLTALVACTGRGANDSGESSCTTEARASVTALITDTTGSPTTPDAVEWSVDGGEAQDAECVNSDCTQWVAGWEVTGEITVTAGLGEATISETVSIVLDSDDCHVVGQVITLVIPDGS